MNRREMLLVGTSTAVAHGLWTTVSGCGAQSGATGGTTPTSGGSDLQALARQAAECMAACDECTAASIEHAAHGMTDMLACARLSRECSALCRAVVALASAGSSRAVALARVCGECCNECAAQCRNHSSMEPACERCYQLCIACGEACSAVTA